MRALNAIQAQRGHLFCWVPVALATGIGIYFALPSEPSWPVLAGLAGLAAMALALMALGRWAPEAMGPLAGGVALVVLGVLLAAARAHLVGAPVLDYRFYGAVQGRVVVLDRSISDAPRLTLDRVWIEDMPDHRTPARIRVSLHGDPASPIPGTVVMLTTHLSPPPAPSEPGGFDFRRRAWFDRIGAVGYTRAPVVVWAPAEPGDPSLMVHRARLALSRAIRTNMPGDEGAFAAAILTGDRSAIARAPLQDLRDSNLAHLLAISGLHMGLLTGTIFAALRFLVALVPWLALRISGKKLAAVGALAGGAVYLVLSGASVATERAFIMVAVMFCAVLLDRRAITLRAVALAATLILLWAPESVTQPGFQMSFAATTALVAVFGALRNWPDRWRPPRWSQPALAVLASSAVAGAATAPFAAAHFNQIAQYGLLANLLTVPLMGLLVMPAALVAVLVAPFGLAWIPLEVMRWGIAWILGVAHFVAGLDGSVWRVVQPMAPVVPLLALGALTVILWQGRLRYVGALPVLLGFGLWGITERPALLISESGGLVGRMTDDGRAISKPKGEGFVARSWLENDGDRAMQDEAFTRAGFSGEKGLAIATVSGASFTHVSGRGWADKLPQACADGWVILPRALEDPAPSGCALLDRKALSETGAIAVFDTPDGPKFVHAKPPGRGRLWSQ